MTVSENLLDSMTDELAELTQDLEQCSLNCDEHLRTLGLIADHSWTPMQSVLRRPSSVAIRVRSASADRQCQAE